jgi:hypothetical protein
MTPQGFEERIAEVQRDMRAHYSDVAINLLGRVGIPGQCGTVF